MSAATLDCSKFSKVALKAMLGDAAFAPHHDTIKAFLEPKPRDLSPVEGKINWRAKNSTVSTTWYPRGYVRVEPGMGNGVCYEAAVIELRDHLNELIASGRLKAYSKG